MTERDLDEDTVEAEGDRTVVDGAADDSSGDGGESPADEALQPIGDVRTGDVPQGSADGNGDAEPPLPPPDHEADEGKNKDKNTKKKKKNKTKELGTSRGIETMFRTSYRTHLELSALADTKANIMISINGIIISITIASISPKIDANPWLMIPTAVLLLACLGSMVYAILAARPRISSKVVDLEDVRSNRANILFFGNFVNMREDDYLAGMHELMGNTEQLYSNMIRDIYSLGSVLSRKYALVHTAYTIFMWGLGAGVLLYVAVLIWVYTWAGGPGFSAGP